VTGGCSKLRCEVLHNLYCSLNVVRGIRSGRIRWADHVAFMGETMNVYRVLVGKPE
jgi:hypothetical protein